MKNVLSWDRDAYSVSSLMNKSITDVRKEYSRLRSTANKRLQRLGASEFKSSQAYQMNKRGFKPLSQMEGQQLYYNLNALMRFLSAKTSTVTGQKQIRAKQIKTFHEHGYGFINTSNYSAFIEFMETIRNVTNNMQLPSEEITEYFENRYSDNISVEQLANDFERFLGDQFS